MDSLGFSTEELWKRQLAMLKRAHYLILYWAAQAEVMGKPYNITNVFDDLKSAKETRTKQKAVCYVETLEALCLIEVKEESNKKNIYITEAGEKALELQARQKRFKLVSSTFLGGKS